MPVHDLPQDVFLDTQLAPYELAIKSTCKDTNTTIRYNRDDPTESDAAFYIESVAQTKYWMGYGLPPEIAFKAALRMGHIPVVKFFMSIFVWPVGPVTSTFADDVDKHHYAIDRAAYYGQRPLIEVLRSKVVGHNMLGSEWEVSTSGSAAANNQIELMKWMHEEGCPFGCYTCSKAAKYGQIESLRFLREELNPPCPWNQLTPIVAAANGHLECLEYALSNGCFEVFSKPFLEEMFMAAAENGHVNCFDYLWEWAGFNVEDDYSSSTENLKIYNDTLDTTFEMIHWIKAAATHGRKEILLYIENKLGKLWTNIQWYDSFKMVSDEYRFGIKNLDQVDLFDYIKNEKINKNMTEFKNYLLQQFVQMEYQIHEPNYMDENGYLVTTFGLNPRKCPKCQTIYPEPIKLYMKREVCDLCYPDMIEEFEKEFKKYLELNEYSKFDTYPEAWDSDDEDSDGSDEDSNSIYSEEY